MVLPVEYRAFDRQILVASGCGSTSALSSEEILFQPDTPLAPESNIELSISWPVLREEDRRIRLVVFGTIHRSEEQVSAVRIHRYEFQREAHSDPAYSH
jgi:hypothetical protein